MRIDLRTTTAHAPDPVEALAAQIRAGGPERRYANATDLELREAANGSELHFTGHAGVFDVRSLPLFDFWYGEFRETIARTAFDNVLARADLDVPFNFMHDNASIMARSSSGTLELSVDDVGLRTFARLDPDDVDVQRVAPKIRRGDVREMSFAFTVAEGGDEWRIFTEDDLEIVERTVRDVEGLYDVTVVPFGAYPQTDAQLNARAAVRAAVAAGTITRPDHDDDSSASRGACTCRAGTDPAGTNGDDAPADPAVTQSRQHHDAPADPAVAVSDGERARLRARIRRARFELAA